jgi:hypothetical protein
MAINAVGRARQLFHVAQMETEQPNHVNLRIYHYIFPNVNFLTSLELASGTISSPKWTTELGGF